MMKPFDELKNNYRKSFNNIFEMLSGLLKRFKNKNLIFTALVFAVAYYIAAFSAISILNHEIFGISAYDVSHYDQAIWHMSRFMPPITTLNGGIIFSGHASFYTILLVPFFWIWNSTDFLYIIQSVALACAVFPLYFYAKEKLNSKFLALSIGLSFLLYPALQNMNMENFHPEVMSVFFLNFALYFMLTKQYKPFFAFLFLSALAKEDVCFTVIFIGLFILFFQKQKKYGLISIFFGIGYYLLVSRMLTPLFNGESIFSPQAAVYSHWYSNFSQNMFNFSYYWNAVWNKDTFAYINQLLLPVLYMPLLSLGTMIMALPSLGINLLSGCPYMKSIYYHYTYIPTCVIFFSLVEGVSFILQKIKKNNRNIVLLISATLIVWSVIININLSSFPINQHFFVIRRAFEGLSSQSRELRMEAINMIPKDAKVSCSYSIFPKIAHREEVYMFPNPFKPFVWNQWYKNGEGMPKAFDHVDYILVDLAKHGDEDKLFLDCFSYSDYFGIILDEGGLRLYKRKNPIGKNGGSNYKVYKLNKEIDISDDFPKLLPLAGQGKVAMLYFPESSFYYRNLLGQELPISPPFAAEFSGMLFIREMDNYVFEPSSSPSFLLEIDGKKVFESINLSKGFHKYRIKQICKSYPCGLQFLIIPERGQKHIISDKDFIAVADPVVLAKFIDENEKAKRAQRQFLLNQPSKLSNGGFEQRIGDLPSSWMVECWEKEKDICFRGVDSAFAKSGIYSAKVENKVLADSRLIQAVKVKPRTNYILSGWIRTKDIPRNGEGAYVLIDELGLKTSPAFGTNDWKYFEIPFKTLRNQTQATIQCRLGYYGAPNTGTAYFDDIVLKEALSDV